MANWNWNWNWSPNNKKGENPMGAAVNESKIDDKILLLIFQTLLSALKEYVNKGQFVWFPPEAISVSEDDEPKVSFQAEQEYDEKELTLFEAVRLLGVTLYHLNRGESELNAECFIFDGYIRPMNSPLWPLVRDLANGKPKSIEEVEERIKDKELQKKVKEEQSVSKVRSGVKSRNEQGIIQRVGSEIKIITSEQAAQLWNVFIPQNIQLHYSEQTIQECIEANQRGENWRLVYTLGLSLRQQRDIRGTDKENQPCFYNNDWWLDEEKQRCAKKNMAYWAAQIAEPNYYLLDFNGRFGSKNWNQQEELITQLGPKFERAHETIIAEACFSTFLAANERLLEDWWHWGLLTDSAGYRVYVGSFDPDGLNVHRHWPDYSVSRLRVSVARKFDF